MFFSTEISFITNLTLSKHLLCISVYFSDKALFAPETHSPVKEVRQKHRAGLAPEEKPQYSIGQLTRQYLRETNEWPFWLIG